ncbi:MAG: hypothetical protein LAN37_12725 [Acidobacteriia bacterium]|nr:hypothetical protein [Terriglobia bacterium]
MGTHKLYVALVAFAVLGLLAWQTLPDERIRWVAWAVLGLFTVRTLVHWRREQQAVHKSDSEFQ